MSLNYWDNLYSFQADWDWSQPSYDDWLEKHREMWQNAKNVIDLGCGAGVNSVYLHAQGIQTIACDFSENALKRVKAVLPGAQTLCFDMTDGLPFTDAFTGLVIADLSLHYFTKATTMHILDDIRRILLPKGHLICRVNAMREFEENERPQENTQIEPHLYFENRKGTKRFFDRNDIDTFFGGWSVQYIAETTIYKYGATKYAWEVCVEK